MSFNESIYINTVRNRYCRADVGQEKSQSIDNELSKSIEVPPPFRLVAEYRRRQGINAGVRLVGRGGKEKDTDQRVKDVLACRGE